MKLTKETLKRNIKEELDAVLSEEDIEEGFKQDLALTLGLAGGIGAANLPDTSRMTLSDPPQTIQVDDVDNDASSSMFSSIFAKEEMKTKAIEIENLFSKAKKLEKKAGTAEELNLADSMMRKAKAKIEKNSDYFEGFGFEFNEGTGRYSRIAK